MSSDLPLIEVRNLAKRYEMYDSPRDRLKQFLFSPVSRFLNQRFPIFGFDQSPLPETFFKEFWALKEISFNVRAGETLGIIGRNGSGKSTLLQLIAGTLTPTSGQISVHGRVAALLELGSGFNPEFSGRENIFLNGQILGLSQLEITSRFDRIVEFADIGDFLDQPLRTYSSGMYLRLAFAVQAHLDASVVIIDEALAVGDVFFRQKCYARLEELRKSGAAIILVSHSMPDVEQFCERAIVLDRGITHFMGAASEASKHYYQINQTESGLVDLNNNVVVKSDATLRPTQSRRSPSEHTMLDISEKPQITNGKARCLVVGLFDEYGNPCNSFTQGQTATFYYEFITSVNIGVPICGVLIVNERGVIVFGKNASQYTSEVSSTLGAGDHITCRHVVSLNLGPGEYTFEVGMVSMSPAQWKQRSEIPYPNSDALHERICHVPKVGSFSVRLAHRNGVAFLTHHGVADLPGNLETTVTSSISSAEANA